MASPPNFALIGAAGFVAPRHMKAIKDIGGNLVAALDPHDSVGILDSYFPECAFFTEFERFDRHCDKLRRQGRGIDYVSICSPNYLHDSQMRWALRMGADAICEKPLVLNERNLDGLAELEQETGKRVWAVLQCRLHPSLNELKATGDPHPRVGIIVDYVVPRGQWYHHSWKGDVAKSGGLCTNIGIHLFDIAANLYGKMEQIHIEEETKIHASGRVSLKLACVDFEISIKAETTKRIFQIKGKQYDMTNGFTDLHTKVYQNIIDGEGFGIEDAREAIRICEAIRNFGN